jgi:hypothetical protein
MTVLDPRFGQALQTAVALTRKPVLREQSAARRL